MVRLRKSQLSPDVVIKSENDYRKGIVWSMLVNDCHNKCYICEFRSTSLIVEHITPHRGDLTLKYDWNNLFLACSHCNNIKLAKYDDILDPTKCDPEEHIALSIEITDELIEKKVHVEYLTNGQTTLMTTTLLGLVYNGGSTDNKEINSATLRSHVADNLRRFYGYIRNYRDEPDLGYDKNIRQEIDRSSMFAAFKRKIVRDDPELAKTFADVLE